MHNTRLIARIALLRTLAMKPITINVFRLTYTIDFPVILLFAAVSLDIISTTLFIGLGAGVEKNPVLGKLIDMSIWFVPVYLFATDAIFIPFLSDILRKAFSFTFTLISIILAVNNFSLILFDSAFLIDTIGFNGIVIVLVLSGIAVFVYLLKQAKLSKKECLLTCVKFILFILFIVSIHFMFWVITWLAAMR